VTPFLKKIVPVIWKTTDQFPSLVYLPR
jgi:hypothetical protein